MLYGTNPTLILLCGISLLVLISSMVIAVFSISLSTGWLRDTVQMVARSLSPLPALMILFLAMLQRNMQAPHQEFQYIGWIVILETGRGAFAFQSKISEWFSFRFVEGAESIGASRWRILFTQLRPWLWRYTVEFTFAEVLRVLALIIELAAFHVYPKEVVGQMPYAFVGHPTGIVSAKLNWLSIMGPIMNQYSYISYPSTVYGPVFGIMVLTVSLAMLVKGLRGKRKV